MTIENKNIDFLYSDLTVDLYNLYKKSSYLAIDTEAMGLIHGRDRLCLVQICNEFNVLLNSLHICTKQSLSLP